MTIITKLSRASLGRKLLIALPMVWLLIFFLAPFIVIFKISFSEVARALPPYTPLFSWQDGTLAISLSLSNYAYLWQDTLYITAYLSSIKIAFLSTIFTLLIGYPMAYVIARAPEPKRSILLMLVILPFWTSFLLRVYAWIGFLKTTGDYQWIFALGWSHQRPFDNATNRFCRLCRDCLYLFAVYDFAALRQFNPLG